MESPDATLDEYLGVDPPTSSDTPALSPLGVAALAYAQQGKPIFPCEPSSKRPLGRLAPNGFKDATTNIDTIRGWWIQEPDANIGMPTGIPATGTVLDVDIKEWKGKRGDLSLAGLETANGQLPETRRQRTWSGGVQLFYDYVPGIGNSAGQLGKGLDIRGEGGYVVVAPSRVTEDERSGEYVWVFDTPTVPMPEWMISLLQVKKAKPFTVPDEVVEGNRNETLWKLGRSLKSKNLPSSTIAVALIAANQDFKPPLSDAEVQQIITSVVGQPDRPDFTPPAPSSSSGKTYRPSDSGNAERFRDQHRHHARYCPEWKAWTVFDGRVWREDVGGLVVDQMMKQSLLTIYDEAKQLTDEKAAKQLRAFAFECENRWRRAAALDLARSEMPVYAKELDANPWVLNCQNGLLDLKTFELRPPRAEEFCTKITQAAYNPKATDPTWDQFLESKVPDIELRSWLPKLAGYALTGERDQDIMGNPHGPTRSGKTTFCGALREAMGDYATEVDANLFMLSSHGTNHNGETNQPVLATLKGIRLAVSAEANETMHLDEAKTKKITGCDKITAAAKYRKPITFKPQFLWLLHGNDRVKVTVDDDAIWRRIKQIPFKESTAESEVKEEIRNRLLTDQACHDAVLRWAVDGLRRYQADGGLKPFPTAVEQETRDYRAAMNPLADFVRDHCVLEKTAEVVGANFRAKYTWWCDEQNLPLRDRLGDNEIAKHLKRLDCKPGLERGGERRRVWVGIRLK